MPTPEELALETLLTFINQGGSLGTALGATTPSIYGEALALADELLTADTDNFGQSTTTSPIRIWSRSDVEGATEIDEPATSWIPIDVKGISRGVSEKRDGAALLAKADRIVLIGTVGIAQPGIDDQIEIGAIRYSIADVEPVPNGDTPAIYRVLVKR